MKTILFSILVMLGISGSAYAMDMAHDVHMGHISKPASSKKLSPEIRGYKHAMDDMHKDMMIGYTGDVDTDFARGMIPHHQGAVDMAKVELQYGKDPFVRDFAEWVITIQTQEIAMMQHWLTRRGVDEGKRAADFDPKAIAEFEQVMQGMHREMGIRYTGNADVDFVRGMIPHHAGAVKMAAIEQESGEDPELRKLADGIVRTQNGEIAKMRRWLAKHDAAHVKKHK